MLTNARGADVKGYNGLVGKYISRNFQRYGIPLLTNTLSNGLLIGITSALLIGKIERVMATLFLGITCLCNSLEIQAWASIKLSIKC